jgi:DNA-binding phage protein
MFSEYTRHLLDEDQRSLQWLADKVGTSRSSIDRQLEHNNWKWDRLVSIAKAFGMHYDKFIREARKMKGSHV